MEIKDLQKLDVGDIAAYEKHKRDERCAELIEITQKLYRDNIPEGEALRIQKELQKVPDVGDDDELSVEDATFYVWRSMLKADSSATIEQAGEMLNAENMQEFVNHISPKKKTLPENKAKKKKKAVRKKKPRDN